MRSSAGRMAAVGLLVAVLLVAGVPAPASGQSGEPATAIHVSLHADGDARWTVSARYTLTDANETAAFERLADEFVGGGSGVLPVDPYRQAAALASDETGRPMAVENVSRAAEHRDGRGELRLSFVWTNFSRVEGGGERLVLGDVFATPAGTWLPHLAADQALVIAFPEGYAVRSSSRALDNGTIHVDGPATFERGKPSASLQRTGPPSTTPGTETETGPIPGGLSVGAVAAILIAAGYALYRRRQDEADDADAPGAAAADPERAEELLSDEERVLRLLRAEGGRMKQVDIVQRTDWSNAKVSQLLSGMADAGRIEKLRIGRENLISLPDFDEDAEE